MSWLLIIAHVNEFLCRVRFDSQCRVCIESERKRVILIVGHNKVIRQKQKFIGSSTIKVVHLLVFPYDIFCLHNKITVFVLLSDMEFHPIVIFIILLRLSWWYFTTALRLLLLLFVILKGFLHFFRSLLFFIVLFLLFRRLVILVIQWIISP